MVLTKVGVASGALVSKTTEAWALIAVPVVRPALGWTLYVHVALAVAVVSSGGRKPASKSGRDIAGRGVDRGERPGDEAGRQVDAGSHVDVLADGASGIDAGAVARRPAGTSTT